MTGKVGSTLYAAPEVGNGASVRVKYSQKVDLYSLGIIFFEMCSKPLSTKMERIDVLNNLRTVSRITIIELLFYILILNTKKHYYKTCFPACLFSSSYC